MPRMSFGAAMSWLAAEAPARLALVCGAERLTRAELDARANRLARAYAALGVGAGDRVTLLLPNGAEFVAATLATWKLGATPGPLSAGLPERERHAIIELAEPKLIVGGSTADAATTGARCPTLPAGYEADAALSDAPLEHNPVSAEVRVMTSGGSTGRPKLIVDTTPALTDPAVAENFMRRGGTTLAPGPLHHAGPFIVAFQCLLSGGTLVLMSRFDAEQALQLIETERADWVLFVPTMMQRIWKLGADARARYDLASLQTVMCSGAPSPAWLKRVWIDWLGPEKIFEAYGGTERIAGCIIRGDEWLEHEGSVGRPPPTRQMKALRKDGSPCAPGELGEIYMMPSSGQGSTYRYIGATADATSDGWETLGDMGWFDEDGYLYLADRKTDMIVTGGENVYPAEVEAALDEHPTVRSSAVIGLPDEDLGQRIHAIVDAPDGVSEDELREHLAPRLARYKIPRSFEYVTTPLRDDAGKLRRSALREARVKGAG